MRGGAPAPGTGGGGATGPDATREFALDVFEPEPASDDPGERACGARSSRESRRHDAQGPGTR